MNLATVQTVTRRPTRRPPDARPPFGVGAATCALATGGLAVGTTEFVTMGLLPEISRSVGITISQAGNAIAAYALGVVIGAPLITVLGARLPRKGC